MKAEKINEIKVVFDAKSENESLARYIAAMFASELNPGVDTLADIKCTVSEAVTNSIVHGYRGSETVGKITMNIKSFADKSFKITVSDKGCGIEDLAKAREPLYTTDAAGERSGMGFPIMEGLSDSFTVRSAPGRGTSVSMTFRLGKVEA